ncbi:MAG: hypothetical protein HOV97_06335, partial [Nonomuraea sp.]|nr:hypothetical protein [Nonomuraea sp.]
NVFDAFPLGLSSDSRRNLVRTNVFRNAATALGAGETFLPEDANTIEYNLFTGNGHHPSGLVDAQHHVVQGGIHLSARAALTPPITLRNNVGTGNAGHLIWAPPGTVADGGGNQGPCGPTPNPALTCW